MMKITKGMARKLYNEGKEVVFVPDRTKLDSKLAVSLTKPEDDSLPFEKVCETLFYYNCSPETGMKLAYYTKEVL